MKALSGQPNDGTSNTARQISSLVARLLSHFWTADDHPAAREAQITDWIGDLLMFSADTVSRACGEWRRTQTKRPMIADIRKLCIEFHATERAHYAVVDGRSNPLAAEEAYARSVGFASALARRDAIEEREKAYRLAEQWRNSPEAQHDPAIAKGPGRPTGGNWKPAFSPERMAEEMKAARKALGMEE